jgi:hypothetical protein
MPRESPLSASRTLIKKGDFDLNENQVPESGGYAGNRCFKRLDGMIVGFRKVSIYKIGYIRKQISPRNSENRLQIVGFLYSYLVWK